MLTKLDLAPAQLLREATKRVRQLRSQTGLREIRLAVLQGSTAREVTTLLELLLLERGLAPTYLVSEYGRYYEDAVLDWRAISDFKPDFVYVHTSVRNVQSWPPIGADSATLGAATEREVARFIEIWQSLKQHTSGLVLQNNFEYPNLRVLGNADTLENGGTTRFVQELNRRLVDNSRERLEVVVNDINYLAAQTGLQRWHDSSRWFSYKLPCSAEGSLAIARNLASLIAARYGLGKKCLVLDLDNTLWGGIIGDDGPERIVIGRETAQAEAYSGFQQYCLALKERGVILAVASKNNEATAKAGFDHPDSVLKLNDFACFRANWEPKDQNIRAIAEQLNIGLESLVFVDDNPAERALVAAQLPMVAVPDVGEDVCEYPRIIDRMGYFETLSLTADDLQRAATYRSKAAAEEASAQFVNYDEYLRFLTMTAEVGPFTPVYLDRITQLTNKSNQFNLTTRRYSSAELAQIAASGEYETLYVRLSDRFGDHGLISVIIGREQGDTLHVDLWLMSCRVLKRDVELVVLDELARRAKLRKLRELRGVYIPTAKNGMVADHYPRLGFAVVERDAQRTVWSMSLSRYENRNRNVHVKQTGADTGAAATDISRRTG